MSRYEADPNNSKKQQPKAIPVDAYGQSINPIAQEIVNRPNYIIINRVGNYTFAYQSGSLSTYVSGSTVVADAGPVKLDINPVAWNSATAATGDVTFVYTGNVG
tara:strand:+ start:120 stop:431 length:312 start_codon:yes stop_codon:yes gene_type:complete